jgi:cell wall-associated NlpC family hydrolase
MTRQTTMLNSLRLTFTLALGVAVALVLGGCAGQAEVFEDSSQLAGDPEPGSDYRSTQSFPHDSQVEVCNVKHGLNNRSGPGVEYMVLRVLAPQTRGFVREQRGDWYKLDLFGAMGWSHGQFLCLIPQSEPPPGHNPGPTPGPQPPAQPHNHFDISRQGIINVSQTYVGFSYWLGGGRFPAPWDDPQSKDKGSCFSSSFSGHAGHFGADCSGFAAKVWQLPEALPFSSNKHPFTTSSYYHQRTHWSAIGRQDTQRADMLVYRSGSAGHSIIYEGGDPWGQAWTYEARGCAWGVVHNLRAISSKYQARRRHGI